MRLDHLGVGENRRAVVKRDPLRAKEQLGGAQDVGVLAAVERVAQDEVHELVQKQRRRRGRAPRDVEIGGLDARRREQAFAEFEHHGPVLARVGVDDGGDLLRDDGTAGRGHQARVQATLGGAGLVRRNELRAGEVGEDQLVRDREPAAFRARRQVMPG